METDSRKNKADMINLIDKSKKMYVKIKLSDNRKYWERWVSFNKRKWEMDSKLKTLEEVLKSQQDIIDNNYRSFYDLVTTKK
jgi:replication-associated recombination protein RarA